MNVRRSFQSGYSLTEMLVVIAIIGAFSLVTVPQFMKFYQSSKMRTATRQFTSDVRGARQRALTRHHRTAVTFAIGLDPAAHARGDYSIWDQNPDGTWTEVLNRKLAPERSDPIFFASTDFTASVTGGIQAAGDDRPDIVFSPNGTVTNYPAGNATVVLNTSYKIARRTVTVTFNPSGNFRAVEQ